MLGHIRLIGCGDKEGPRNLGDGEATVESPAGVASPPQKFLQGAMGEKSAHFLAHPPARY